MSISSLETLPTEILYKILHNIDARTICVGFRYVCKRFYTITDTYTQYDLNFEFISKSDFQLICRVIRPENIRSLILCENINTINQIILFQRLVDIRRFTHLKSFTVHYFDDTSIDNILEHISTCSLTSLSINIEKTPVKRFGISPCLFDLPASLSSIIAQPTLQNLCLNTFYKISERSWPRQCTLTYLNINCCKLDMYCIIIQQSPFLTTIVLTNCDRLMNGITTMHMSTIALLSFTQIKSLTLESIAYINKDQLKFFLSLTPSLVHLQLTSQSKLFNDLQWEEFIVTKLPVLEKFQFYFRCRVYRFLGPVDPASKIISFKTLFWLNKGWFVTCDYIERLESIRLYSIPICKSDYYYISDLDKISYSTNHIMNNDATTMDNVHDLTVALPRDVTTNVSTKEHLLDHHLFRNITRLEVRITKNSSIGDIHYLSSLIDFSNIVAVKLNSIENICSMIPRNVKQLNITVQSLHDMIMILTKLTHLYTVVFQFPKHFPDRPQDIITWLTNKRIDFAHHYEYSFLSIWLGKTMTYHHLSTVTSPYKKAKMLHRYDDF